MSSVININSSPAQPLKPELSTVKKGILVALTCLLVLGMVLSYALGAPWFVTVAFFASTLVPLFPLGRIAAVNKLSLDNIIKK